MFVSSSPILCGLRRSAKTMFSGKRDSQLAPQSSLSSSLANSGFIHEKEGDLFRASRSTSLAHCVSSDLRMGRGIAVFFKKKFGQVEELKRQKKYVGEVAYIKDGSRYIFYLVTKKNCYDKPTELTLRHSLLDMKDRCKELGVKSLAMPRIGCGLDGLKWPSVFRMLCEIFSDFGIEITVYSIPDRIHRSPMSSRCLEKPLTSYDFTRIKSPLIHDELSKRKVVSGILEEESPKELNHKKYFNFSKEESSSLCVGKRYSEFSDSRTGPLHEKIIKDYSVLSDDRIENLMVVESNIYPDFSGNGRETPKVSKSKYPCKPEEESEALRGMRRRRISDHSRERTETPKERERNKLETPKPLISDYSYDTVEETEVFRVVKREDYSDCLRERTETHKKRERTETSMKNKIKNCTDSLDRVAESQTRRESKNYSNDSEGEKRESRRDKRSKTHSDQKIFSLKRKRSISDSDGSDGDKSLSQKRRRSKSYSAASVEETEKPKRKKHKKHSGHSEEESDKRKKKKHKKKHSKSSKELTHKTKKHKMNQSDSSETEDISKKRKKGVINSLKNYLLSLPHALRSSKLGLIARDANDVLSGTKKMESKRQFHKVSSEACTVDLEINSQQSEEILSRNSFAHLKESSKWVPPHDLKPEMSGESHQLPVSHGYGKLSPVSVSPSKRKFSTSRLAEIPNEMEEHIDSEKSPDLVSVPEQVHRRFKTEDNILSEKKPLFKTLVDEDSNYLKSTLSSRFEALTASQKTSFVNQTVEALSSGDSLTEEDHSPRSRRKFLLRTESTIKVEEEDCYVSQRLDGSSIPFHRLDNDVCGSQKFSKESSSSDSLHKKGLSEILKRRLGAHMSDKTIAESRHAKSQSKKGRNCNEYPVLNISKIVCRSPCIPVGSMYSDKEKAPVSVKNRLSLGVRLK